MDKVSVLVRRGQMASEILGEISTLLSGHYGEVGPDLLRDLEYAWKANRNSNYDEVIRIARPILVRARDLFQDA